MRVCVPVPLILMYMKNASLNIDLYASCHCAKNITRKAAHKNRPWGFGSVEWGESFKRRGEKTACICIFCSAERPINFCAPLSKHYATLVGQQETPFFLALFALRTEENDKKALGRCWSTSSMIYNLQKKCLFVLSHDAHAFAARGSEGKGK